MQKWMFGVLFISIFPFPVTVYFFWGGKQGKLNKKLFSRTIAFSAIREEAEKTKKQKQFCFRFRNNKSTQKPIPDFRNGYI